MWCNFSLNCIIVYVYEYYETVSFSLSFPFYNVRVFAIHVSLIKAPHHTSAVDIMKCKWRQTCNKFRAKYIYFFFFHACRSLIGQFLIRTCNWIVGMTTARWFRQWKLQNLKNEVIHQNDNICVNHLQSPS